PVTNQNARGKNCRRDVSYARWPAGEVSRSSGTVFTGGLQCYETGQPRASLPVPARSKCVGMSCELLNHVRIRCAEVQRPGYAVIDRFQDDVFSLANGLS